MKKSLLTLAITAAVAVPASASTAISGGIWVTHQNELEKNAKYDDATNGVTTGEALILYVDHSKKIRTGSCLQNGVLVLVLSVALQTIPRVILRAFISYG